MIFEQAASLFNTGHRRLPSCLELHNASIALLSLLIVILLASRTPTKDLEPRTPETKPTTRKFTSLIRTRSWCIPSVIIMGTEGDPITISHRDPAASLSGSRRRMPRRKYYRGLQTWLGFWCVWLCCWSTYRYKIHDTYTCTCAYACTCTYTYTYTYIHIHLHYIDKYIYICIHTRGVSGHWHGEYDGLVPKSLEALILDPINSDPYTLTLSRT